MYQLHRIMATTKVRVIATIIAALSCFPIFVAFIPANELQLSFGKVALLLGFYSLPVGLGVWLSLEDKFAKTN